LAHFTDINYCMYAHNVLILCIPLLSIDVNMIVMGYIINNYYNCMPNTIII
jgi:hypothetical protein